MLSATICIGQSWPIPAGNTTGYTLPHAWLHFCTKLLPLCAGKEFLRPGQPLAADAQSSKGHNLQLTEKTLPAHSLCAPAAKHTGHITHAAISREARNKLQHTRMPKVHTQRIS
jgi:hypothetical protein